MRLANRKFYSLRVTCKTNAFSLIMPKESLKDKLEGNELDLSLSNLEVVPVKELVRSLESMG